MRHHWHILYPRSNKTCRAANILMASKSHFHLILFSLLLSSYCLKSSSWSTDRETDYNKWVSWNVENHRKRAMVEAKSIIQTPGATGKVLDGKLRKAEMTSMRINVSQDGTGDFTTIKEALNSIPPHNTRRVIIAIKPGVYRYGF